MVCRALFIDWFMYTLSERIGEIVPRNLNPILNPYTLPLPKYSLQVTHAIETFIARVYHRNLTQHVTPRTELFSDDFSTKFSSFCVLLAHYIPRNME